MKQADIVTMGFNNTGYPGAFTPKIAALIEGVVSGRVLHLFSGQSLIGDERVDVEHQNATVNVEIGQFVTTDTRDWDWVILDPPYGITRVGTKLSSYGVKGAVSGNVGLRRLLKAYLQQHAAHVLWFDICAPMVKGFERERLWLVLPGGFHTVRVLSMLRRVSKPML